SYSIVSLSGVADWGAWKLKNIAHVQERDSDRGHIYTSAKPALPCVEHPRQRNGGKNRIIHKPSTATFSCNGGHSAHPPPRGRTSVPPDRQPPGIFDQAEPITAASVSSSRRTGKG